MTASTHDGWVHSDVSRNYWLPPYGRGNGYDAPAWAPIANVPEELVDHLLTALADADVPAHAACPGLRNTTRPWCVWVGSQRYATAEDVLRRELSKSKSDSSPERGCTSGL